MTIGSVRCRDCTRKCGTTNSQSCKYNESGYSDSGTSTSSSSSSFYFVQVFYHPIRYSLYSYVSPYQETKEKVEEARLKLEISRNWKKAPRVMELKELSRKRGLGRDLSRSKPERKASSRQWSGNHFLRRYMKS